MSLYNELAKSMGSGGLLSALSGMIGQGQSALSSSIGNALGGGSFGQAVGGYAGNAFGTAANNLVNRHISPEMANRFDAGFGLVGDISRGDWNSAGMRLLDVFPGISGIQAQGQYRGCATPVVGGISISQAQQIIEESRASRRAQKNLFLVEVSSQLMGDFSHTFNMFCTGLDFAPITLSGQRHTIGSASADSLTQSEAVELNITTYDDEQGTIRRWMQKHAEAAAPSDGTVGVPGRYAIRFKMVHAFITRESNKGGYEEIGLFRPQNLAVSMNRSGDEAEERQLTFTQLDTFMPY